MPVAVPLGRTGVSASVPAGGQLIPDGIAGAAFGPPAVSTVDVAATGTVDDVDVKVDIRHTFVGDLEVRLISPAGTKVAAGQPARRPRQLRQQRDRHVRRRGGEPLPPNPSDLAIVGTFRPSQPLSAFDGQNLNGTWRLEVRDGFQADIGTLNAWSTRRTECDAAPAATPPAVSISGPDTVFAGGSATTRPRDRQQRHHPDRLGHGRRRQLRRRHGHPGHCQLPVVGHARRSRPGRSTGSWSPGRPRRP